MDAPLYKKALPWSPAQQKPLETRPVNTAKSPKFKVFFIFFLDSPPPPERQNGNNKFFCPVSNSPSIFSSFVRPFPQMSTPADVAVTSLSSAIVSSSSLSQQVTPLSVHPFPRPSKTIRRPCGSSAGSTEALGPAPEAQQLIRSLKLISFSFPSVSDAVAGQQHLEIRRFGHPRAGQPQQPSRTE